MKAAVILSGCGHLDGSEIREAVLSLLYLDQQGVAVQCYAPDKAQHHVVNHLSGESEAGGRNILQESARIARGNVKPLHQLQETDADLLVIPGGYGAAKNLSTLAFDGASAWLEPEFTKAINAFYAAKKPIVAICIAPAVLAAALPQKGITLTIGEDSATAQIIEKFGNIHKVCASHEACMDEEHRIITCSAYMRDDALSNIAKGIEQAVSAAVKMSAIHSRHVAA